MAGNKWGHVNVKVTGEKGVIAALESMKGRALVGGRQAVAATAIKVQRRAKMNATQRPGPNVDTGRLRSSIRIRSYEGGLAADVFTDVEYAVHLEFGFKHKRGGYFVGPFPFLVPAWEAERGALMVALKREISGGI